MTTTDQINAELTRYSDAYSDMCLFNESGNKDSKKDAMIRVMRSLRNLVFLFTRVGDDRRVEDYRLRYYQVWDHLCRECPTYAPLDLDARTALGLVGGVR